MTASPAPFPATDSYLEATVRTASPARMRLMIIERGIEVASTLSQKWRSGELTGPNEHSLKLLDLLNELLNGVGGSKTESENLVCQKVADLYVFLLKHLLAAEADSDASKIDEIRVVLSTEADTWRAVCANETQLFAHGPSGLNFQA